MYFFFEKDSSCVVLAMKIIKKTSCKLNNKDQCSILSRRLCSVVTFWGLKCRLITLVNLAPFSYRLIYFSPSLSLYYYYIFSLSFYPQLLYIIKEKRNRTYIPFVLSRIGWNEIEKRKRVTFLITEIKLIAAQPAIITGPNPWCSFFFIILLLSLIFKGMCVCVCVCFWGDFAALVLYIS